VQQRLLQSVKGVEFLLVNRFEVVGLV
jgi:hypothetical protein